VEAFKQQKLDDALARFQKSVEESPTLATGHYYKGVTLERKGDSTGARAAFEKAIELQPDYAQAHSSLGLLYWRQADHERGLTEFRQAVLSDPDFRGSTLQPGTRTGAIGSPG